MVIDHLGSEYSVRIHFASFWSNTHSEWIVDRHAGQLLRCDVIITLPLNVIVIQLFTTGKRFEQRTSGLDYSRLTSVVTRRTSAVFGVKTGAQARIALSEVPALLTYNTYEVVLGAQGNLGVELYYNLNDQLVK